MFKYLLQLLIPPRARGGRSLRRQLLTLSLLAVLAGHGMLLVAHALLSASARRTRHQQGVERVRLELLAAQINDRKIGVLQDQLDRLLTPGMVVWVMNDQGLPIRLPRTSAGFAVPIPLRALLPRGHRPSVDSPPREFRIGQLSYVSSSLVLPLQTSVVKLGFLTDVSDDMAQEQIVQILLAVSALATTLITGLLLRPAIRSGLQPLEDLGARLEAIQTDTLAQDRIPVEDQPLELLPIVEAFNDLLQRLADAWDRQRSFVNGVSHELRTPITIIAGYARRLGRSQEALTARQQQQIGLIAAEADRMALLVNDLLDLARSDAGRLELSRCLFEPVPVLWNVRDRLQEHAGGRLILDDDLDTSRFPRANGDPGRVEQCLANLVENALKYAPGETPVRLHCSCSGAAGAAEIALHVIDQGPGVPLEDRERIFERFQRGSQASGVVGSGIGLAVVHTLMQAMGGRVDVVAAEGGGADFRLHLPAGPVEASEAETARQISGKEAIQGS